MKPVRHELPVCVTRGLRRCGRDRPWCRGVARGRNTRDFYVHYVTRGTVEHAVDDLGSQCDRSGRTAGRRIRKLARSGTVHLD